MASGTSLPKVHHSLACPFCIVQATFWLKARERADGSDQLGLWRYGVGLYLCSIQCCTELACKCCIWRHALS